MIPDDAIRYVIAAVVPCENRDPSEPTWAGCVVNYNDPVPCPGCLGNGTRVVVTDVEVTGPLVRHNWLRSGVVDTRYLWEQVQP